MKKSQLLPMVEIVDKEKDELMWPRVNQIRLDATSRGLTKDPEIFFSGMVKKLLLEKEAMRA